MEIVQSKVSDFKSTQASSTERRIAFLDALRFVAAVAVLFQHFVEKSGEVGQRIVGVLSPGVFGVVLFFTISGYVIPMAADRHFNLKRFFIRRIFRIYPLVLATFIVVAALGYSEILQSLKYVQNLSVRDWISNVLLVQDYTGSISVWGVTWTLSLELVWYVIFGVGYLLFGREFNRKLIVAIPIVLLTAAAVSILLGHRIPIARPGMIYAAVVGCQFYLYQNARVTLHRLLIDFSAFVIVMLICNIVAFGIFSHPNITMNQAVFPWLAASIIFALFCLTPSMRKSQIVNNHITTWFGTISFSIYMLHPLAYAIAVDVISPPWVVITALPLTIALSTLGYYAVEKNGQKIGKKLTASANPVNSE